MPHILFYPYQTIIDTSLFFHSLFHRRSCRGNGGGGGGKQNLSTQDIPLAFNGPCDLTVEGHTKQLIHDSYPSNKVHLGKQPVYAIVNPSELYSEEVYHEVTETSTDEDIVNLYSTVESEQNLTNSKHDAEKHFSVVYAKVQKSINAVIPKLVQESIKDEGFGWADNAVYSGFQDDGKEEDGWEDNVLYGRIDGEEDIKRDNEIPAADTDEGWEDNVFYGDTARYIDTADTKDCEANAPRGVSGVRESDTEGWEENALYSDFTGRTADTEGWKKNSIQGVSGMRDSDTEGWADNALYGDTANPADTKDWEENGSHCVSRERDSDTEGWEDNALYGDNDNVDSEEGWEDNVIYAGSDED